MIMYCTVQYNWEMGTHQNTFQFSNPPHPQLDFLQVLHMYSTLHRN